MLQIKEIPNRPREYDGALCLFALTEGIGELELRERLQAFGDILSYEAGAGSTPTIVRFSTRRNTVLRSDKSSSALMWSNR